MSRLLDQLVIEKRGPDKEKKTQEKDSSLMTKERATTGQPYRDYILSVCDGMPIDDRQVFEAKLMEAAWPASDREAKTPAEGLRADLGESFEVRELPDEPGTIEVHRAKE